MSTTAGKILLIRDEGAKYVLTCFLLFLFISTYLLFHNFIFSSCPCRKMYAHQPQSTHLFFWYSFDVRGRGMKTAKTWSSKMGFDRRADFQPASHPAYLLVNDLKLTDQGVYRCRVDFRNSPTRNSLVNLTVVGKCRKTIHSLSRSVVHSSSNAYTYTT